MKHAKFGNGHWKPFQRGLIVSTNSMLRLASDLLDHNFDFVLPGRTTQDCVENLFSIVRSDNAKPNALQVKHALKSIAVSEYLTPVRMNNTSYHLDDSVYLTDFLKVVRETKALHDSENIQNMRKAQSDFDNVVVDISKILLNNREKNVLYKTACFLLYKISITKFKSLFLRVYLI